MRGTLAKKLRKKARGLVTSYNNNVIRYENQKTVFYPKGSYRQIYKVLKKSITNKTYIHSPL